MLQTLVNYLNGSRDSSEEIRLKSLTRKMDENEKTQILKSLVDEFGSKAFIFVGSCTDQRCVFNYALDHGLKYGDASSIRIYLEMYDRRLGPRNTLLHLISRSKVFENGVKNALYWLPRYIKIRTQENKELYKTLLDMHK